MQCFVHFISVHFVISTWVTGAFPFWSSPLFTAILSRYKKVQLCTVSWKERLQPGKLWVILPQLQPCSPGKPCTHKNSSGTNSVESTFGPAMNAHYLNSLCTNNKDMHSENAPALQPQQTGEPLNGDVRFCLILYSIWWDLLSEEVSCTS